MRITREKLNPTTVALLEPFIKDDPSFLDKVIEVCNAEKQLPKAYGNDRLRQAMSWWTVTRTIEEIFDEVREIERLTQG